jgi:hypothetical protein
MAKVTITIEGDPDEVRRTLRKLAGRGRHEWGGRCGKGPEGMRRGRRGGWGWGPGPGGMSPGGPEWQPWTVEELTQVWGEITAGARRVLAEIARRPEGYPAAELQAALGMDGKAIGGTLSSVGVLSRRYGERMPLYLFGWDAYRMRPRIAEVVRRLAEPGETPPVGEAK